MDDVARDPEIGPELVAFLSQKVKEAREAMKTALNENETLREENKKLKEEKNELYIKPEAMEGWANITCQIGQCTSKDEVERLKVQLAEMTERFQAVEEDLQSTTSRLAATEGALQESVNSLTKTEQKYEKLRARSMEKEKILKSVRTHLSQFQAEVDSESDSSSSSESENGAESAKEEEESESEQESESYESKEDGPTVASVDQSSVHENGRECANEEEESESEQESESSESSEDEDGPTVASVDQSPTSPDFATQPCIPFGTDPSVSFAKVQHLMCGGSALYRPELCSIDMQNGSAILYHCGALYRRGERGGQATWITSTGLNSFIGKRREMFYRQGKRIYYAGTFKASLTICDLNSAQYRALDTALRERLVVLAARKNLKSTSEERSIIAASYWDGENTIQCLEWQRIGFNTKMFTLLLNQLHDAEVQQQADGKRKSTQRHDGPATKKFKNNEE